LGDACFARSRGFSLNRPLSRLVGLPRVRFALLAPFGPASRQHLNRTLAPGATSLLTLRGAWGDCSAARL